jgi:hypothetical protein
MLCILMIFQAINSCDGNVSILSFHGIHIHLPVLVHVLSSIFYNEFRLSLI